MLLIYLPGLSPRCNFIFDLVFKDELGIQYATTTDVIEFQNFSGPKLNYSDFSFSDECFIKSHGLLFENEIKKHEIEIQKKEGIPLLFYTNDNLLDFDIFSAVFYLVSRYEEYLPFIADEYGRYKAENSLAFKNNFLQIPVVNIWINMLKDILQKKYLALQMKLCQFNAIVTYDIDVAFKYSGRNFGRSCGAVFKNFFSFNLKDVYERLAVLLKWKKDPWDVYDDLSEIISKNKLPSIFFFLLSDKSSHDRNLNYQNPAMKKLVNKIRKFSKIGIHPSFYSSEFPQKIQYEKERLEMISNQDIYKSRQHYLRFSIPETYNSLLKAGVTEDYSMAYTEMPGFRAGTCNPFYFYDLKSEKTTSLKIFPVTFMEGTFIEKSTLNAGESLQKMLSLIDEVQKVQGTFISIWHNHTLSETSEYKAWREVHQKMIDRLVKLLH